MLTVGLPAIKMSEKNIGENNGIDLSVLTETIFDQFDALFCGESNNRECDLVYGLSNSR